MTENTRATPSQLRDCPRSIVALVQCVLNLAIQGTHESCTCTLRQWHRRRQCTQAWRKRQEEVHRKGIRSARVMCRHKRRVCILWRQTRKERLAPFGNQPVRLLDAAEALLRGDAAGDPSVKLQRTPLAATRTHGWERPYAGWTGGDRANASTIGHTGFTGTGLWIDFDNQRAWALLTNRVHPSRYAANDILQLRRAVGDAVNSPVAG